jgi:signal transduction histidine kinase
LYSALVFGLGGLILGLVYLAVRWQLQQQFESVLVFRGEQVSIGGFKVIMNPVVEAGQVRSLESLFDQFVLDRLARFMLMALGILFVLSLVVGWLISGRALAPVKRIATVAQDIEASDLSRRIGLEGPDDELTRLAGTFDAMLDRLEKAFSGQRRFLADTSHDLRTPLAVIRSNIEVTLNDPDVSLNDWRETGEIVVRNAERMGSMIDDLLATARLEANQAGTVEIDLAALVAQVVGDSKAAAGDIELISIEGSAPMRGDPISLTRALTNLVDNAVKASPHGGRVRVASGTEKGWVYLAVGDEGSGFDPNQAGGGLGLSIVRQVAEMHGGHLEITPNLNKGTSAVIWLPVDSDADPPDRPDLPPL